MQEINWLKNTYTPPQSAPLFGNYDAATLQLINKQQFQFQDAYDRLQSLDIEVTSVLDATDPRSLLAKLQNLLPTDRISLEGVVVYEPSAEAIRNSRTTVDSLELAEQKYRDQRGEIAFDVGNAVFASAWTTAQLVYDSAGRLIENLPASRVESSLAPTQTTPSPSPWTKPVDVATNAPRIYNPGLSSSVERRPYNNPMLAQSTLADEQKWNDYYVLNDKSMIVTTNTEVEQTEIALGKKRPRDAPNVTANSLKTIEDATKNVEHEPVVKKMKTQPPAPTPKPLLAPNILTMAERKADLDRFTQSLLSSDVTCDELRPLAQKLQTWFNNDPVAIKAYLTQQVLQYTWNPVTQYNIGEIFKQCLDREKALIAQRAEADSKPPPGIQPTFAPDPPPAPSAPTPTPDAAPKLYIQEKQLQIVGPTPEMQPAQPVFAANEQLFEYSCVDKIEFTAPLNDTITMPAETPQEAAKIQNEPATQERVPERVNNQTTGIDLTLANTNIINQAGEGVATATVANEPLQQKPPVSQQRVPKNEKERKNTLPIAASVILTSVGATYLLSLM